MRDARIAVILSVAGWAAACGAAAKAAEPVSVVGGFKDLTLRYYGFIETDALADTTQGFNEFPAGALVPNRVTGTGAPNFAGLRHRTQFSVRDSRLGFEMSHPATESGFTASGVLEMDFLANDAATQQPGGAAGTQTESGFFTNAGLRVRLAYANLTWGDWNLKLGQYWSLLGWQPYSLLEQGGIPTSPAEPFGRMPQVRLTRTAAVGDGWTLESAVDAAKPGEMNSGNPEIQAGVRLASTKWKGPLLLGGVSPMVGLSAAVSAAAIPTQTNGIGNPTAQILVFDAFVPLLPSADGKSRSNTLVWQGEFMAGTGAGSEFPSMNFGVPGITAATPGAGTAIDAGIAGLNGDGNAELIRSRSFHTYLSYFFPGGRWAVSAGYGQAEARNLDRFTASALAAKVALAPKIQFGVVSVFFDPVPSLRFALECSQNRDTYNGAGAGNSQANRFAVNNRLGVFSYLMF